MTINVATDRGGLRIVSDFLISPALRKKIETSLRMAILETKPVDELLVKLKKGNPAIGTSRGALIAYMTGQSWSQKKLAKKTGISQADISKMVHGKRPIGLAVAKKFGQAFGVDYRRFL